MPTGGDSANIAVFNWILFQPTAQTDLETDEVVPRLLSRQEMYMSEEDPVYRLRHHHQWPLNFSSKEHTDAENMIVSLSAFGRSLYLNLTRDLNIFSRNFVIEERLRNQSVVFRHLSTKQLCFYSGFIINHTDSLASLSTCGGLVNLSFVFGYLINETTELLLISVNQMKWFIENIKLT